MYRTVHDRKHMRHYGFKMARHVCDTDEMCNCLILTCYSEDFLKVNHFRRCHALYVRDPRVWNYRVSTCVASRVSRRYHYSPIKSYNQHVYDHTVIVVLAMSAQVVKHQSYYLFIPAKPTQVHAGMLLSNQIL